MSINQKLSILLLSIAIIPMLFIGISHYNNTKQAVYEHETAALGAIADLKVKVIKNYFKERRADIDAAHTFLSIKQYLPTLIKFSSDMTDPAFISATNALDPHLMHFKKLYGYEDVTLSDKNGIILYCANKEHAARDIGNYLPGPQYKIAHTQGLKGVFISNIFKAETPGAEYEMILTAPIHDEKKEVIGVLSFEIDMNIIYDFIQDTTGLYETGETLIGRRVENHVLFLNRLRHDPAAALKRRADIGGDMALPMQRAVSGKRGTGISVDYRDKEIIAAWRYIPKLKWGLVAKIDTDEAFSIVTHLRNQLTIASTILIIVIIFIALFASRSISGPITRLTKAAASIIKGDMSVVIRSGSKDELGQLAAKFGEMAENLNSSYETIKDQNAELDKKVKERTAALDKAKRELENKVTSLEKFARLSIGRELKMKELKSKISDLETALKDNGKGTIA